MLDRRDLLRLLALAPLASWHGRALAQPPASGAHADEKSAAERAGAIATSQQPGQGQSPNGGHRLVLIQLAGGNDGLNTLVPHADANYRRLRPRLALPTASLHDVGSGHGMHPALAALLPAWRAGDLAWVHGVGYPRPNRSHFRSTDIWLTASDAEEVRSAGWLGASMGRSDGRPSEGLMLGSAGAGPLRHSEARATLLERPEAFIRMAKRVRLPSTQTQNPALSHLLRVQTDVRSAAHALERHLRTAHSAGAYPKTRFGRHMALVGQAINSDLPVPMMQVTLGGFDTHAGQAWKHARLLKQLGDGIGALRKDLVASGRWKDVLVMTWSEFGRRPAENGSRGTDHGAAAPHLLAGGAVKGRLIGTAPSLMDLQRGDLKHSVDFRRLHHTAAAWLGVAPRGFSHKHYPALQLA